MKQLDYKSIQRLKQNNPDPLGGEPLPLSILIDGMTNLANLGSIFRLADAVRLEHIYFHNIPLIETHKLKRYSRGCHTYVPYSNVDTAQIQTLSESAEFVACEYTDESQPIGIFAWQFPAIVVLGSERHGISQDILDLCQRSIHLPMLGRNSSVNVANAAGVVLYDALSACTK